MSILRRAGLGCQRADPRAHRVSEIQRRQVETRSGSILRSAELWRGEVSMDESYGYGALARCRGDTA
jgi:hypothetical protein